MEGTGHIPLFDGHCDTLSHCCWLPAPQEGSGSLRRNGGHLDLERAGAAFRPYAQFFAIFARRGSWPGKGLGQMYEEQYALFRAQMAEHAGLVRHCRTAAEAEEANASGLAAAFLSVEGAELLDCSLEKLEGAWRRGVRAVNLTWNHENALAGSCAEGAEKGLTALGRQFTARMYQLGMLPDLSHLSDPGFWDVAALAEEGGRPLFASHSNARALCPHKRNLTDGQITAIIKSQGVAGINLWGPLLSGRPCLEDVVAHVDHFCALGGEKNVGIGGDWDGCGLFPGMEGIGGLAQVYEALLRRNYREDQVRAIFRDNMMRVVRDVCTM